MKITKNKLKEIISSIIKEEKTILKEGMTISIEPFIKTMDIDTTNIPQMTNPCQTYFRFT